LGCTALAEVIFEWGSYFKEINGFRGCKSLSRIIIPSSVKGIHFDVFFCCASLTEVIFEMPSHCRAIYGSA
jgi:hypothetical protein